MSDIKRLKKFEDEIEVLSIEDLDEERASRVERKKRKPKKGRRKRKRKRRRKRRPAWQRALIGILIALVVLMIAVVCMYFAFRSAGEKNLKIEAKESTILYNGKEYTYKKDVINILCLGIDKAEAIDEQIIRREILGMADAILAVSIDTKANTVKIIAIPRDTLTDVTVTSDTGEPLYKEVMQLCYQYGYGKTTAQSGELMAEAVSELLYNVPIEKYCAINFEALPVLNDAIGGVDLVVQEDLSDKESAFVLGNTVHLEGHLALSYVRLRHKESIEGVTLRTQRQKQYVLAFLEKAKAVVANDLSLPVTVFQELQGNMSTNVSIADITYLVPELLEMSFTENDIQMLPGVSAPGEQFLEYHADQDAIKELVVNTFYEEYSRNEDTEE